MQACCNPEQLCVSVSINKTSSILKAIRGLLRGLSLMVTVNRFKLNDDKINLLIDPKLKLAQLNVSNTLAIGESRITSIVKA